MDALKVTTVRPEANLRKLKLTETGTAKKAVIENHVKALIELGFDPDEAEQAAVNFNRGMLTKSDYMVIDVGKKKGRQNLSASLKRAAIFTTNGRYLNAENELQNLITSIADLTLAESKFLENKITQNRREAFTAMGYEKKQIEKAATRFKFFVDGLSYLDAQRKLKSNVRKRRRKFLSNKPSSSKSSSVPKKGVPCESDSPVLSPIVEEKSR